MGGDNDCMQGWLEGWLYDRSARIGRERGDLCGEMHVYLLEVKACLFHEDLVAFHLDLGVR